jgi:D-serine deaminase-like pyridoxal phosphate-dependent protein
VPGREGNADVWELRDLETPALVVDLDVATGNLRRMQERADRCGLRLWPHTKTHKVPALARLQMELGAAGLTVAKAGEAEVLRDAGLTRLHLAYPPVGEAKARRLADLLNRGCRLRVALDSAAAAACVADAAGRSGVPVEVLVEVDVGLRRVGVAPGEGALALARQVASLPGLVFAGLESYAGHIGHAPDEASRLEILRREGEALQATKDLLERDGLAPAVVSVGGTHHAARMEAIPLATEIRPGTYVYNDRDTLLAGSCDEAELAAFCWVTVVSRHADRAVVDGGSKTLSSDGRPGAGYGLVRGHPSWRVDRLNEEHGVIEWPEGERGPSVGDRLAIVPNHICATVNLHDRAYGLRGGEVAEVLEIAGRGKLR